MPLKVSEEAIAAERTLSSRLNELHKDLLVGTKNLLLAYDENRQGLGQHTDDIQALLSALVSLSEGGAASPVKKLVRRLTLSANNRQHHLDNSLYHGKIR